MKIWTLESPGAGLVLHLVFLALVLATVRYSERNAAPSLPAPPPRTTAVAPPLAMPVVAPHGPFASRMQPVADGAPRHPTP